MAAGKRRVAKARSGPSRDDMPKTPLTPPSPAGLPAPYQVNYSVTYRLNPSLGVVRGSPADWFGPLNPMSPSAPPEVAGRQFDYPSGYNLNIRPRAYSPIGFGELRSFADSYDVLRLLIETRKDQMARLRWTIAPRDQDGTRASREAAAKDKRVIAARAFWERPDGENNWNGWLRALLEDLLVIDAPTLYVRRNRAGQMMQAPPPVGDPRYGLALMDGSTIKRVIDDWGRTPLPWVNETGATIWPPAYQQQLKGLPAVDYLARDMIYRPRNLRTGHIYGYSPVEQIIVTINIALRRQLFTLNYFTEGNIPEALLGAPDNWTPTQIKEFQVWLDTLLQGDLATRRKMTMVPGGVAKTYIPTKDPELKGVFDEWLARVCCFAFSISPAPFVAMMNRATAEAAQTAALEEGIAPLQGWVKALVDDVLAAEQDAPDLEFRWEEDEEVDPVQASTINVERVRAGVLTLNESRRSIGEDPYDDPAADLPMVLTANGYVPINENTIEGRQEREAVFGPDMPAGGGFGFGDPAGGDPGGGSSVNDGGQPAGGAAPSASATGPADAKLAKRSRRLRALRYERPAVRAARSTFPPAGR